MSWEKKNYGGQPTQNNDKKYAIFIGRYQPYHYGHINLIQQKLNDGIPVLIMVRDIEPDEKEIEEYDHLIGDNELTESRIGPDVRRRVNKIDKLVDVMLNDMYVEDYESEEQFFQGVMEELYFLVKNEDFGVHDVEWIDIYDYIDQYRRNDINEYYREHLKDEEISESELTERCWKGYRQKGMKTMFGKKYPNCVKIKKK